MAVIAIVVIGKAHHRRRRFNPPPPSQTLKVCSCPIGESVRPPDRNVDFLFFQIVAPCPDLNLIYVIPRMKESGFT